MGFLKASRVVRSHGWISEHVCLALYLLHRGEFVSLPSSRHAFSSVFPKPRTTISAPPNYAVHSHGRVNRKSPDQYYCTPPRRPLLFSPSLLPSPLAHGSYAPPTRVLNFHSACFQLPLGLGTVKLHGLPCPANPGPVTFSLEVTLPSIAPPGDYDISIAGLDPSGSSAMCLDVLLKL